MVLKELIFNSFYMGGGGGLERTHLKQFLLWEGVVVLKELILTISTLGECAGLETTDFEEFLHWEGV